MKFFEMIIIDTILLAIIILVVISALNFPLQAKLMPLCVGIPALFLMSTEYISRIILKKNIVLDKEEKLEKVNLHLKLKKEIIIVLWLIGLVGITLFFGFNVSILLFLFSIFKFQFSQNIKNSFLITFSVWVTLYISFEKFLRIPLNCGVLFK